MNSDSRLKLDSQQRKAVEQIDKNLYVTASAGSGKTRVLTYRYIHILKEKVLEASKNNKENKINLEEILAITFTEKAANEMKERILQEILKELSIAQNKGNEYEITKWTEIKNKFRFANISTIHGFCSKLIREYPIESYINPEFEIIDEMELLLSFRKFIKEQIITLIQSNKPENIAESTRNLIKDFDLNNTIKYLQKLITNETLFEMFYKPAFNSIQNKEEYQNIVLDRIRQKRIVYINHMMKSPELKKTIEYLTTNDLESRFTINNKKGNHSHKIVDFINLLHKLKSGDMPDVLEIPLLETTKGNYKWDNKTVPKYFDGDWEELRSELHKISQLLPDKLFFDPLLRANENDKSYERIKDIIKLYEYIKEKFNNTQYHSDEILNKRKNKTLLTFNDLQLIAYKLLNNSEYKEIRNLIRKSYKYIMVDETQDIDRVQYELIRLLALGKDEEDKNISPNLFIVGDGKQSIYKFRGADVSTFTKLIKDIDLINGKNTKQNGKEKLKEKLKEDYNLYINYRSITPLVNFTNKFFKKLLVESPEDFDIYYGKDINTGRKDEINTNNPAVEILISQEDKKDDDSSSDNRKKEAGLIADRIAQFIKDGIN
ncbi:MAG: UvrD-helicase domain-containing protein, partial [Spirochaetota bacterium]